MRMQLRRNLNYSGDQLLESITMLERRKSQM